MHTNASGHGSQHPRAQNPLSERDRSRRSLGHRAFKRADERVSLFQLTVLCRSNDAVAVDTLVRTALGENLMAQRRERVSKASGKQFRELEVIVRCPNASLRTVMAVMGRLEHEPLVCGVVWESVPDPTRALDPNFLSLIDQRY
jgi:hypothetical protein